MNKLFKAHILTSEGLENAKKIAEDFDLLLNLLEADVGPGGINTREFCVAKTKLEEACFFAKKAIAVQSEFQVEEQTEGQG